METPTPMTKNERKLQDKLNRIMRLLPGKQRIWELDRIAMELDMEADSIEDARMAPGLRNDALYLRRLEWDLAEMRDELRGNARRTVAASRLDPSLFPRGPRP